MPLPIRRRCEAVGYGECMTHRVLVLTGGPAAGKSTTALALATTTPRTAFIDVDDVRQLVKNGGAAPWDGEEGASQQLLGVRNATWLARSGQSCISCNCARRRMIVDLARKFGVYGPALGLHARCWPLEPGWGEAVGVGA